MSSGPGGNTSSPVDCSVCNHSGRYTQCPGCGGLIGMGSWPPCKYCHAAIGVVDPPPPPMTSTIHAGIEATEPRTLPDERQRRHERDHELARAIATWEGGVTPLPPLEAFAAEAATERRDPIEAVMDELFHQREVIREMSRRIGDLTQAVLGRNHNA